MTGQPKMADGMNRSMCLIGVGVIAAASCLIGYRFGHKNGQLSVNIKEYKTLAVNVAGINREDWDLSLRDYIVGRYCHFGLKVPAGYVMSGELPELEQRAASPIVIGKDGMELWEVYERFSDRVNSIHK